MQNIGHTSHTAHPVHTPIAPVAVPPPVRRVVQRPAAQPPVMPQKTHVVVTTSTKPAILPKSLLIVLAVAFGGVILILMVAKSFSEPKASSVEKPLLNPSLNSEKIVVQKGPSALLREVWVDDARIVTVKIDQQWGLSGAGLKIQGINLVIGNNASPIEFDIMANVSINGQKCRSAGVTNRYSGKKQVAEVYISNYPASEEMIKKTLQRGDSRSNASLFKAGDKCSVSGTLFYGESKSLNFQKEVVFTDDDIKNAE